MKTESIRKRPAAGTNGATHVMSSTIRCLEALELLACDPFEFGLTEIVRRFQLPKGTAHRLMATLVEAGFVTQDSASRHYRLAPKALWIGAGFLRHSAVYRAGFSVVQEISKRAEGLVHLAVPDGDQVMYLHTVGNPSSLYLFADTGERRPIYATALGKAILAYRPAECVDELFSKPRPGFTEKTITSAGPMNKDLAEVRRQGFALDDEESVRGLRCVAAPIFDQRNEAAAAISISAPAQSVTPERRDLHADLVREAALRISVYLGYRPGTTNVDSLVSSGAWRPAAGGESV